MAEGQIDPKLIGEVLKNIPYESIIAQPLKAAIESQAAAAKSALDFIMTVGFQTDENGVKKATYLEMEYEEENGKGEINTRRIKVPTICMVNIPQIEIDTGIITFSVEISQSASVSESVSAGGEGTAKLGWGPFSMSVTAKASYSKDNARKSDTRARQEVTLNLKQADPPEALNVILEIFREAALGTGNTSGGVPQLPGAGGGGGNPPPAGGDNKKK